MLRQSAALHALRESAIAAGVAPARVLDLLAAAFRAGGDYLPRVNHDCVGHDCVGHDRVGRDRVGRDRVGNSGRRRLRRGLTLFGLSRRLFGSGARGIGEVHQAALGEHDAFGYDLLRRRAEPLVEPDRMVAYDLVEAGGDLFGFEAPAQHLRREQSHGD